MKRSATLAQPAGGGGKKSKLGSTISLNKPMHIQVIQCRQYTLDDDVGMTTMIYF